LNRSLTWENRERKFYQENRERIRYVVVAAEPILAVFFTVAILLGNQEINPFARASGNPRKEGTWPGV